MSTADRINKFHAHLDICEQCKNDPFNLCTEGEKLIVNISPFTGNRKTCILCDQNIPHTKCDRG